LAKFLQLKVEEKVATAKDDADMDDSSMSAAVASSSKVVSTLSALSWFTADSSELMLWLEGFKSSVTTLNLQFMRKALKLSLVWKQPRLLRLPKNYDQIFQASFKPCNK
jgi:hypothetical protein